ncbi:DUF6069 family protein [Arthrobacter sp. zg-Y1143]|uniref:DUF6069 family protein n=1 Tax=Arthrobacter sp. zg-Y1143 TaxID=3049065 RepID=UPI0024C29018|nr:DUF6069 family protein [Arthrobacter sp. zg-Y1143]MDK1327639.1 DUF6069 family protein [Arthrobacter sp. zg-Y1143]
MSSTSSRTAAARTSGSNRPLLLTLVIVGAAALNLVLFYVFRSAGAEYANASGMVVGAANVLIMSVVPLLIGLVAVVLLSRRWPSLLRIGRWAGAALALLTIGMTAAAGFDTLGFTGLALMHVVVAAGVLVALRPGVPAQR